MTYHRIGVQVEPQRNEAERALCIRTSRRTDHSVRVRVGQGFLPRWLQLPQRSPSNRKRATRFLFGASLPFTPLRRLHFLPLTPHHCVGRAMGKSGDPNKFSRPRRQRGFPQSRENGAVRDLCIPSCKETVVHRTTGDDRNKATKSSLGSNGM